MGEGPSLKRPFMLVLAFILAFVLLDQGTALASTTWYTGQRAFAGVTVEPAVNLADGSEIFLLTPNGAPFPSKAAGVATAPLYLPLAPPLYGSLRYSRKTRPTGSDNPAA